MQDHHFRIIKVFTSPTIFQGYCVLVKLLFFLLTHHQLGNIFHRSFLQGCSHSTATFNFPKAIILACRFPFQLFSSPTETSLFLNFQYSKYMCISKKSDAGFSDLLTLLTLLALLFSLLLNKQASGSGYAHGISESGVQLIAQELPEHLSHLLCPVIYPLSDHH